MNSVQKDSVGKGIYGLTNDLGNYLVSSRHYCAVYYVNGTSGDIIWTLNGQKSSFTMGATLSKLALMTGPNASFAFQHDANFITNSRDTVTIFDNGSSGVAGRPLPTNATQSRGIQLHLNFSTMTATLDREYLSPTQFLATSQGNVQILPNGNAFLGWGGQWYGEACPHPLYTG